MWNRWTTEFLFSACSPSPFNFAFIIQLLTSLLCFNSQPANLLSLVFTTIREWRKAWLTRATLFYEIHRTCICIRLRIVLTSNSSPAKYRFLNRLQSQCEVELNGSSKHARKQSINHFCIVLILEWFNAASLTENCLESEPQNREQRSAADPLCKSLLVKRFIILNSRWLSINRCSQINYADEQTHS